MWKLILFRVQAWWRFYRQAKTRFNLHSLFQHTLAREVLEKHGQYYCFQEIENHRKRYLTDRQILPVLDFGAGTSIPSAAPTITVAAVAARSLSPRRKCEILFHLVRFSKAEYILELGTSLGISTAYLASADSGSEVITLEGNPAIAAKAKEFFQKNGWSHIRQVIGPFQANLDIVLDSVPRLDFIFLDGHHAKEPTLLYFEKIIQKCNPDSVIVVDDVHWSKEMEEAWQVIQKHPRVFLTVDLYFMGLVFLNPALSREHLSFVPYRQKPWNIGLFGK